MNRGGRREAIFYEDGDWELFEETLSQTCEKTDGRVQAWCLMSNQKNSARLVLWPAGVPAGTAGADGTGFG